MASLRRLLLLVDDPALSQVLEEHLAAAGFAIVGRHEDADLALVDGDRPDGPTHCQRCRALGLPTVALSSQPGLSCDLLLSKPLRLATLAQRLTELLGRFRGRGQIGPWYFDPDSRTLEHGNGHRVKLTDKETAILAHLRTAVEAVSRESLLTEVWGYSAAATTHTLETHIYRLRRKIEVDPTHATLLVTEAGGYRLVG